MICNRSGPRGALGVTATLTKWGYWPDLWAASSSQGKIFMVLLYNDLGVSSGNSHFTIFVLFVYYLYYLH